jgi:hypothetical protein
MIWVRHDVKKRVEDLRIVPEEPVWRVLARLIEEHDCRIARGQPEQAGLVQRTRTTWTFALLPTLWETVEEDLSATPFFP